MAACCDACASGHPCEGGVACEDVTRLRGALGPLRVKLTKFAPGSQGVEQTVPAMQELVAEAVRDPRTRRVAEFVVACAPPGARRLEAAAIFRWLERRLQFRRDPTDMQYLQDPLTLLERIERVGWAAGNCANHAVMAAALGHAIRLPVVWVLANTQDDAKDGLDHVYAAMRTDGLSANDPVFSDADLLAMDTGVPYGDARFGVHGCAGYRKVVPALRGL